MKKPLIGVTCNYDFRDEAGRVNGQGAIGQDWNFVAADYIRSLEWAGALPVVIPQFDDAAKRLVFESGWMGCWSVAEMMWTHSDIISRCEIADG